VGVRLDFGAGNWNQQLYKGSPQGLPFFNLASFVSGR
jgi:hypothetical protein